MSNNLNKLYALPESLHAQGCPVIIVAGALYKFEGSDEKILLQLKFKNMGDKIVKAIKVDVQTFDVSGNPIDEKLEHQYLDLSIGFNSEYVDRKGVFLRTKTARSFNAKITEIVFNDGDILSNNVEFQPLPKSVGIKEKLGDEFSAQYKREIGKYAKYEPYTRRDIWCCTCGEYNRIDENYCHSCKTDKVKQFEFLDHSLLSKNKEIFEKEEQIKMEKQAQAERIQKEKNKKVAMISVIAFTIFVLALVSVVNIQKKNTYNKALSMMNDGNYSEAIEIFESLGEYKDCREQVVIANKGKKYSYAVALLESQGDHTKSYNIFKELDDYKDSKKYLKGFVERVIKCNPFGINTKDTNYIYDNEGYLINETFRGNFSYSKNKLTLTYTYDNNIYTEKYDENGNLVFFNCVYKNKEIQKSTFSYEYDKNGEVAKQYEICFKDGKEHSKITRTYTRDINNTILTENIIISYAKNQTTTDYTYEYEYKSLEDGHTIIISTHAYTLGWVYAPKASEKSNKLTSLSSFKPYMDYYLYAYGED